MMILRNGTCLLKIPSNHPAALRKLDFCGWSFFRLVRPPHAMRKQCFALAKIAIKIKLRVTQVATKMLQSFAIASENPNVAVGRWRERPNSIRRSRLTAAHTSRPKQIKFENNSIKVMIPKGACGDTAIVVLKKVRHFHRYS